MSISPPTILSSNPNLPTRTPYFPLTSTTFSRKSPPSLDSSPNFNPSIPSINSRRRRISMYAVSGSTGTGASVVGKETTNLLERVEVFDLNGKPLLISDLWKDRKAVVAFARHFGCVLCRKRADYLAAKKEQMDASGVALVLIGPGSVDQEVLRFYVLPFQNDMYYVLQAYKFMAEIINNHLKQVERMATREVYADPSYSSYKALQFVSGVLTTFTPGSGLKIIEAYMEGYRQDWGLSFEKDTRTRGGWQQGGIIVAGSGISNISYIHKDKEAGDDPAIEDILKACCS